MKIFFIILFVLAFLACTVSAIGNQWFNSHFINAADTLEQTSSEMLNRTEEMFMILSSSDLISANTETSLQSLNSTQIEVTSLVNDMKRFNEMRYVFLWIILVFVVFANLLAVVSGLLQAKVCVYSMNAYFYMQRKREWKMLIRTLFINCSLSVNLRVKLHGILWFLFGSCLQSILH
jgi:hypothetical protein